MKQLLPFGVAAVALVMAAPVASIAQPNGENLFNERCAVCHGASAPPKEKLAATHTQAQIVEVLTTGAMAPMADSTASQKGKPSIVMQARPQKAPSIIRSPWAKLTVSVAL